MMVISPYTQGRRGPSPLLDGSFPGHWCPDRFPNTELGTRVGGEPAGQSPDHPSSSLL